ncbi:hypothetical protein E4O01_11595 [Treponema sp. OMZ 790]|nr:MULTISPECIES: hypothetical protein [unclassified Treponema]UTC69293.1 hypothetical protein E4O01_11595 [Treponema sp. OMZ 790]UTC72007.1 hypothetical protein E4O02_11690 [Treponema sp. OMZ 791]
MGRLLHIGLMTFLGISFIFCTCFLYRNLKNTLGNGKRLIDEPVNENTKTGKLGLGEILVYGLMFIIAILFVVQIIYKGSRFPSATAVLTRTVILVPIMAFFNARKRTGKSLVVLFASLLFLVFCTIAYIAIGLPVKAPVLTLNNTEIKLGHTAIKELMNDGFDIYTEKGRVTALDIMKFPNSNEFEKYSGSPDISVAKGYHRRPMKPVPYSKAVLVKNNAIIARLIFYGSMKKETPLKDCSIIYFWMKKDDISKAKDNKISIKLNGVDMLSVLKTDTMKKTFGRKILRPHQIEADKHYLISWHSNSNHLFYNSYTASIDMDDNYLMTGIELECQIAREAD